MGTFAEDIAYVAVRRCGGIMAGSAPSPEILEDCRLEANNIIDEWQNERLMIYQLDDRYFNITVSQQSYTVGVGGDIDPGYNPVRFERGNLVLLNNVAQPVRIPIVFYDMDKWFEIPVIQISSQVTIEVWVQRTYPKLTMWCFPYPTIGNQFELGIWKPLTEFTTVTDTFNFPQGYKAAIVSALALKMWPLVPKVLNAGRQDYRMLVRQAAQTKSVIEGFNAPTPTLSPDLQTADPDGSHAPFNYLIGDYSQ